MAINLSKGQRIEVGFNKISVGLGWQPAVHGGPEPDLDASVFMVDANRKIPADEYFVFYNNLKSPDASVEHTGDVLEASEGDEDEETINVDLSEVDARVQELIFVVTIHDAGSTNSNFGQVRDAYIRILDEGTNNEIAKYELSEDFSIETSVEIGRFYRKDNKWKFEALGYGYNGGLEYYLQKYN